MNYIKTLQCKIAALEAHIAKRQACDDAMSVYLHSPKFVGFAMDGSRKDWIAVSDLVRWMRETNSECAEAEDSAELAKCISPLHP